MSLMSIMFNLLKKLFQWKDCSGEYRKFQAGVSYLDLRFKKELLNTIRPTASSMITEKGQA